MAWPRTSETKAVDTDENTGPQLPSAPPKDHVLLEKLRAGDKAAFTQLVETYHHAMVRLARVYVPSQAIAEEVTQEAWLGVINGLERFEGRSSLKTWIFRILTNRAKTRGVREGRSVPFSSLPKDPEGTPAIEPERFAAEGHWSSPPKPWEQATPESIASNNEAIAHLQKALETLPDTARAVVELRDIEQLESVEVCAILDISQANQRVLLHRGRAKLRTLLAEFMEKESR